MLSSLKLEKATDVVQYFSDLAEIAYSRGDRYWAYRFMEEPFTILKTSVSHFILSGAIFRAGEATIQYRQVADCLCKLSFRI